MIIDTAHHAAARTEKRGAGLRRLAASHDPLDRYAAWLVRRWDAIAEAEKRADP